MQELILYHGSPQIIERPEYGKGKPYNDYGVGFYCTESLELAKEWACTAQGGGFANKYLLNMDGLSVFSLTSDNMNILNWLAVLINNRTFRLSGDLAVEARDYLLKEFLPDMGFCDVIRGYRADNSYFSFAAAFLNGGLSLEQLSKAMRLGKLGEQVVLKSERAFNHLSYIDYEQAEKAIYYPKREVRDTLARDVLRSERQRLKAINAVYIIDILRGEWKNDDPRLRGDLFR